MRNDACRYVLVSDALGADQLAAMENALAPGADRWRLLKANRHTDMRELDLAAIEAIYISVDVLGESSKDHLTPLMSLFCDVALNAPRLRWLQASSAGLDRPQFQALLERGVTLAHAGGVASRTVAHAAIAGLLALGRELPKFMALQRAHRWAPARGADAPADIGGQTAVVVGLGAIGQEIARLCQALDISVIGFNRRGNSPEGLTIEAYPVSQLEHHIGKADWLILSCPLTQETHHLIDAERLASLKPTARLIDVSRGGVVHSRHLLTALQRNALAGAYLDVFETEPLAADSPFWDLPNVIITPHAAGDSTGRSKKLDDLFVKNLKRFIADDTLINGVKR